MKKVWLAAIVALSLTGTAEAGLFDFLSGGNKESSSKDIHVVPAQQVQQAPSVVEENGEMCYGTVRGGLFSFAKPAKRSVAVGEPLQLSLKLKKKAYIYLIAVSNRSNRAYMILPNRFEGYNLYRANRHYVIPERSADYRFVSDAPGTETVYIVASTYKQSFNQLLNKFGKKELGGFRVSSAKAAQSYMKDILVVPARTHRANVEVRKIHINVR